MLDIEKMLCAGVEAAKHERVILAAPYELSVHLCRNFASRGLIAGYVAGARIERGAFNEPLIEGEWIDPDDGRWRLYGRGPSTVVFLGATEHIHTRMLLEAQRAGIHRIIVVHVNAEIAADIDVRRTLFTRIAKEILKRIHPNAAIVNGQQTASIRAADLTFGRAYELMYNLFEEQLRLPADSFVPRRLLIIAGSLGPGGAERQIAYTAAGITKSKQYEVFVGCNYLDPPADFFRPYVEAAGASVLRVPYDAPEFRTPEIAPLRNQLVPYDPVGLQNLTFAVFHYALLIRSVRPTFVHTWMDYCNVLGGIAADLVGVPHIIQSGRSMAPDHFSIFQPYMRPGYRSLFKRRKTILLNNSRAGAQDYARWLDLPPTQIRVIHNGFEFPPAASARVREDERRKFNIHNKAIVVGSVIRFSEEKRPKLLIDMARVLLRTHPKLKFLIFGAGPMFEDMKNYVASCGCSESIQLPGVTKDVWASLAAMDIFVLTSRMEGLPNVLIEAQASRLPVVCTAVGGMAETYVEGETGLGVSSATAEGLAEAVSRLIEQPKLRQDMSKKALGFARNNFGMGKMISKTLDAYAAARSTETKPATVGTERPHV